MSLINLLNINVVLLLIIINILTQVISLPLDSKEQNQSELKRKNLKKFDQNENFDRYSSNEFGQQPSITGTRYNATERHRREKLVATFVIEILKNVQAFTNEATKLKIQNFINDREIEKTTTATKPQSNNERNSTLIKINELINAEIKRYDANNRIRRQSSKEGQDNNEADDTENEDGPPSGLAGLIASLSGGEEGSDVGALIGALSSAITNIFGPNGIDITSLLSTGTSLLAGLLGGDEGFGKVLAGFFGTAVDGLSGGGGAENNGQFFGNFLGALVAQLSADPEGDSEENLPPTPLIFVRNFLQSFQQQATRKDGNTGDGENGSDSFSFITHIVTSIVGGITSIILNGSLGSSGGSSQGSVAASAGSSNKHPESDTQI